jgi:hypothetical protein
MGVVLGVIVLAVLALLFLGLLMALVVWLLGVAAVLAIVALGGFAGAVIAGAAGASEAVIALSMFGGAGVTGLALLGAWRGRVRRKARGGGVIEGRARVLAPQPEPDIAEPAAYPQVAAAWTRAQRLAPGAGEEFRRARNHCARLLALAEGAHHDDLPLVTQQVPGLVSDYQAAIALADVEEARDLRRRMVAQLCAIGEHANAIVEAQREQRRDALAARELHLERRLGRAGL